MTRRASVLLLAVAVGAVAAPAAADTYVFSYDAATPDTRRVAGRGLTLLFEKGMWGGARLRKLYATNDPAGAGMRRAAPDDLGEARSAFARLGGGLELYEITPDQDGGPLIRALCPGATRGWLAVSALRSGTPLRLHAFGSGEAGARLCVSLDYQYRGEWRLPDGRSGDRADALDVPVYPE